MTRSSLLLLLFFAAQCSTLNGEKFETKQLIPGVWAFNPGSEYFSMFVVTGEGVIVVEPVSNNHSTLLVGEIKKVTNEKIRYLIYSHNHWDHTSGGKVFKENGTNATILAHAEATEWITANTGPTQVIPDESWDGLTHELKLGNITIDMTYHGINHGRGMIVLILREHKFAYISDIVVPNRVFFNIAPDFNIKEWERSLREILRLDFKKGICTHNNNPEAIDGCDRQDVQDYIDFMTDIRAGIKAYVDNGTNVFEVPTKLKLQKYEKWAFYKEWFEMSVWAVLVADLTGNYPWRPPRVFPTTTTTTTAAPSNGLPMLRFNFELFFITFVVAMLLNKCM